MFEFQTFTEYGTKLILYREIILIIRFNNTRNPGILTVLNRQIFKQNDNLT